MTKKERNKIYKKALELREKRDGRGKMGICFSIYKTKKADGYLDLHKFPELHLFGIMKTHPNNNTTYYILDKRVDYDKDDGLRSTILAFAIVMTEN